MALRWLTARLSSFSPGGCLCCAGPAALSQPLCEGCELQLSTLSPIRGAPPDGVDSVISAAEHRGVARELVAALKFRRRLAVAKLMATRIAPLIDSRTPAILVPVPSAPWRSRRRGFNPAAEISRELSGLVDGGVVSCLGREGEGRQVGSSRGQRRAPGFRIHARGPVPRHCLLVDDVFTTGGTLSACAIALREGGAMTVAAATFTRRP